MFSLVPNNTHYRALLFTGAEVVVGETKIQRVFIFFFDFLFTLARNNRKQNNNKKAFLVLFFLE